MAKYRVLFHYTEYGEANIEANSPEEAEKLLDAHLNYYGLDELDYESNDRDYNTQDADKTNDDFEDGRKKEVPPEELEYMT